MRSLAALHVVLVLVATGCSGDDGTGGNAGDDAGTEPDAGQCGGDLYYQVEVFSWATNAAALPTDLSVVGSAHRRAMSDPNGRAALCLPPDEISEVRFDEASHLPLLQVVSPSAYESYIAESGQPAHRVFLLKRSDLDAIGPGPSTTGSANVLVEVRNGEAPASGATVEISSESDALQVGSPGGPFANGYTITSSASLVVARNASTEGGSTTNLTITPESCDAPPQLPLLENAVTATLASCSF